MVILPLKPVLESMNRHVVVYSCIAAKKYPMRYGIIPVNGKYALAYHIHASAMGRGHRYSYPGLDHSGEKASALDLLIHFP